METSASTGRAEGIADGDMVSLKKNLGVNCKSASQVNKGKRKSGICYLHISDHDPEFPDFV